MERITRETILGLNRTVTESGCWILKHLEGYPSIYDGKKVYKISRIVAHLWHGLDLNNSFDISCHKCNNRRCFNPEHIYKGTDKSNMDDAVLAKTHVQARKEHHTCGRPYDRVIHRSDGSKDRSCSHCSRNATIRWRKRNKK